MGLFDKLFNDDRPSLDELKRQEADANARLRAAKDAFNKKQREKFGDDWEDIQ